MTKSQLTDYPARLMELATTKKAGWQKSDCPVVRSCTLETTKAWRSVVTETKEDEGELFKKCELAIDAQTRYRREAKKASESIPQPKLLSAWLRAGRWEEIIDSHAELKQKQDARQCVDCDKPTLGPGFIYCAHHTSYTKEGKLKNVLWAKELRDFYQNHKGEDYMQCKDKARAMIKQIIYKS